MYKFNFLVVCLLAMSGLMAQPYEKKGADILDQVSAKTKAYKTMKIEFTYHLENKDGKVVNAPKDGVILIKGAKYHLTVSGQVIICDGKTLWTYLKDADEVQINTYDPTNEDALNPQKVLTNYKTTHKPKYIKDELYNGKNAHAIDLTPIKGKNYFRIRVYVDVATKQLLGSTIYQKSGDKFIYKIKKITPDTPIADTKFTFNKTEYPGVEVIYMR